MAIKSVRRFLPVLLALITVLSFAAFSVYAAGASLNKTSVRMTAGSSYTLKVSGTKEEVKWSTSDKKVVTVSSSGKIKAVGAGSAVVTAKAGKTTLKCKVTVIKSSFSLNKTSVKMVAGSTYTLKASGAKDTVTWSTSDKKVASVSSSGKVKAVGTGSAVITAKSGGNTVKCRVTVVSGSISLNKSEINVSVGKTAVVEATVKGSKDLGYSNSNSKAASVKFGSWSEDKTVQIKITGVKAGKSTVKIYLSRDSSVYKTVTVNVVNSGGRDDSGSSDSADGSDGDDLSDMSYAEQVIYYVNIEREKAGVKALKLDDKLCDAAKIRSDELLTLYSHDRPDGRSCFTVFDEVGVSAYGAGENIAAGYPSAKSVVNGWMNSSGHRANILNPDFTKMGASMSYNRNLAYKYYWAQLFAE